MPASKMISLIISSALATAVLATAAFAGGSASDIRREALERRDAAQKEAIVDGRRDGSITIWEKFRLNREQKRIDKLERNVLADGRISKQEYVELRQARNDAGRSIDVERHNGQVRGWWWRTFSR